MPISVKSVKNFPVNSSVNINKLQKVLKNKNRKNFSKMTNSKSDFSKNNIPGWTLGNSIRKRNN